jgi:hypothetical protein
MRREFSTWWGREMGLPPHRISDFFTISSQDMLSLCSRTTKFSSSGTSSLHRVAAMMFHMEGGCVVGVGGNRYEGGKVYVMWHRCPKSVTEARQCWFGSAIATYIFVLIAWDCIFLGTMTSMCNAVAVQHCLLQIKITDSSPRWPVTGSKIFLNLGPVMRDIRIEQNSTVVPEQWHYFLDLFYSCAAGFKNMVVR